MALLLVPRPVLLQVAAAAVGDAAAAAAPKGGALRTTQLAGRAHPAGTGMEGLRD